MDINAGIRSTRLKCWSGEIPSSRSDPSTWIAVIAVIVWVQILDLVTTRLVIDHGGTELNPLFNQFLESIWFWPIMTFAKMLFLLWLYIALTTSDRYSPKAAWVAGGLVLLQNAAVVGNNILVLFGLW
ncbi:DUF5658 family protein [uncultured Methanospirillum sp.]|uniref:DUF5658 family protein n=1 Tax=uncultured Methanospirillum sp. TaxID=262503 RepID=UPI0029C8EE40|nr:DUF5658 family protein [uncultured Methanospirillum sp.]